MSVYCPHCGRTHPEGQRCPCRPRPKRRPTEGDATRAEREPWRAEYSSSEYRKARQRAIGRQLGRCADCGRVCAEYRDGRWYTAGMGGEVDHGRALCEGGGSEVENLTLRCKSCHKKRDDARRAANRYYAQGCGLGRGCTLFYARPPLPPRKIGFLSPYPARPYPARFATKLEVWGVWRREPLKT